MEEMYDNEDRPKKPTYVTRVVTARKNAGFNSEQEPRAVRGVAEHANNKEDKAEDDQVNYDLEPAIAHDDHKETPREPRQKKTSLEG